MTGVGPNCSYCGLSYSRCKCTTEDEIRYGAMLHHRCMYQKDGSIGSRADNLECFALGFFAAYNMLKEDENQYDRFSRESMKHAD